MRRRASWFDANFNITPDCILTNPLANGECGQIDNLQFGSNQLVGANFDPDLFSGWGVRPSDWSFGVSVQQELFPRASVEVGYYRRSFTHASRPAARSTDNLAVSTERRRDLHVTVPSDPRLPDGGGYTVGPLYDLNPNVFGQVEPADPIHEGRRRRYARVQRRGRRHSTSANAKGFTFQGGTSTGKVTNDCCEIRAAVPEATVGFGISLLTMPFCIRSRRGRRRSAPWSTYTIPRIDVNLSSVFQDKPNIGTDQIGSLAATYTLTAADLATAAAQIGRPLTAPPPVTRSTCSLPGSCMAIASASGIFRRRRSSASEGSG